MPRLAMPRLALPRLAALLLALCSAADAFSPATVVHPAALRQRDWDAVKRLVDDQALSDERIAPEARDEVAAARDEWSNREIMEQLTNALADGGASGSVGAVKHSTIKLELLDKGLAHAEEAGIKTEEKNMPDQNDAEMEETNTAMKRSASKQSSNEREIVNKLQGNKSTCQQNER